MTTPTLSRRGFLHGMGAVVVSFTLAAPVRRAMAAPEQPLDPKWSADEQRDLTPELDGWLRIDPDGTVTLFTGRVEIGNGILTALSQVVAEELDVPFEHVMVISADTDTVPNQGITSATTTMGVAAVVIRQAAATARQAITEVAATQFGVTASEITIRDGIVATADGAQERSLGELIGGQEFARDVDMEAPVKSPKDYTIVGQSIPRIDIPAKLTGGDGDFIENARVEGMTYARLLRAPAYGARLLSFDESVAEMDGIVAVIHIEHPGDERLARVERLETMPGDFIAVVAETENLAIKAIDQLRETAEWDAGEELPVTHEELYDWVLQNGEPIELIPNGDPGTRRESFDEIYGRFETRMADTATYSQTYRGPYLAYGPISPAYALADVREDRAVIHSSTQWPFGSRWMVAQALGYDEETQVQVIGGASSGLYGRRDDYDQEVDVEAAILSQQVGRPVRLQWSRTDELVWGQYRPPQVVELEALLDDTNQVAGLHARVHTAVRGIHPEPGIAAMALQDTPYTVQPLPVEGFDAGPLLRTGYMRNVFSGYNMFALESFMDELAANAGEDPIDYRIRHLEDERAIEVINAVKEKAGWQPSGGSGSGTGMGISFVLYTNEAGPSSAYMAYIAEVEVDEASGKVRVRKFTCAIDPGLVVNPDGVRNQVEGGVIQAMSWAMKEQVTFDRSIVTSHDWAAYPILTFNDVPEIEVVIIDRKDQPSKGIGEPVTVPVAAAIANAVYDATGVRIRELPLTPDRVRAALSKPTGTATPQA